MYGKIFESTFTGSMVGTGVTVFAIWSYVIANTRPPGHVELNPVILGAILGCPAEDVTRAIEALCQPDPASRSPECEGRRLVKEAPFLFSVPTWARYRATRNDDERKAYNREAQRKSRERRSSAMSMTVSTCQPPSAAVSHGQPKHKHIAEKNLDSALGKAPRAESCQAAPDDARQLLGLVNKLASTRYQPVPATLTPIVARVREYDPYTLAAMLRHQWAEWQNDDKMRKFFRPKTLFSAQNCANYVGQLSDRDAAWLAKRKAEDDATRP